MGGMTKAVASGMPKLRIEEAAARRQAGRPWRRGDRRRQQVAPARAGRDRHPRCRQRRGARQPDRAAGKIRATRDQAACDAALKALEDGAAGEGNLLELAVEAARARATVGEISMAMEKVFGRHRAEVKTLAGVYGAAYEGDEGFAAIQKDVEAFAEAEGRRPRMLVVKMGQDGHDRGAKVIATAFADIGFDVDVGPPVPDPGRGGAGRRRQRRARRRHLLAGGRPQDPGAEADRGAEGQGAEDIIVICGGVIPHQDYEFLKKAGVKAIFGPGTNIPEAAADILKLIGEARAEAA
jgi:methylmalonyl-CoA mutase